MGSRRHRRRHQLTKRRKSRHCIKCRASTRSTTGYCAACRPSDAIPAIHRDGNTISFAGLNFTAAQAITLANNIIDTIERNHT